MPPATDVDHRGQLEKLARRGTASVVGAGFSAVFGVLLVVIVTNGYSPTVAGTFFAATSAFLILEAVALLGTDTGLVRCLPVQLATGRAADLRRTLVVAAVPVLGLSLGVGGRPVRRGAGAGTSPGRSGCRLHDDGDAAGARPGPARGHIPRRRAGGDPRHGVHATDGRGREHRPVRVAGGRRPGDLPRRRWSPGARPGLVVALRAWSRGGRRGCAFWSREDDSSGRPRPGPPLAREFWAYTAPRAIARIIQAGLKRSDIVLVAALASPADAALYTAATRFVVLGQLFVQSVQQALSPHLSSLFARGEKPAANSVFQAATLWSMIAAWPLYLVTAGFASTLIGVFGDGYDAASDVVVILSLTMLLATACGPVDSVLLMAGRSWLSLRNSTVALAVNVGLNVVLIPVDGIRGAAVSWSVAIVVRNLLPLVQVRRHLGMWPVTRSAVPVALGAVACFGVVDIVAVAAGFPLAVDAALLGLGQRSICTASGRGGRRSGSGRSARRCDGPTRLDPTTSPRRWRPREWTWRVGIGKVGCTVHVDPRVWSIWSHTSAGRQRAEDPSRRGRSAVAALSACLMLVSVLSLTAEASASPVERVLEPAQQAGPQFPGDRRGRVYLGMSCDDCAKRESQLGQGVGLKRWFKKWDDWSGVDDAIKEDRRKHRPRGSPSRGLEARRPAGSRSDGAPYDDNLRGLARVLKAHDDRPIFLSFDHEVSNALPDDQGRSWAQRFKRFHDVLEDKGALDNVALAPIVAAWLFDAANPQNPGAGCAPVCCAEHRSWGSTSTRATPVSTSPTASPRSTRGSPRTDTPR